MGERALRPRLRHDCFLGVAPGVGYLLLVSDDAGCALLRDVPRSSWLPRVTMVLEPSSGPRTPSFDPLQTRDEPIVEIGFCMHSAAVSQQRGAVGIGCELPRVAGGGKHELTVEVLVLHGEVECIPPKGWCPTIPRGT